MTFWIAYLLFPPAWLFILWFLAKASRWSTLATSYRYSGGNVGVVHSMRTAYVGLVAYGGLNISHGDEGLQLQQILPFRPFHPTLLIPWHDIRLESTTHVFFKKNLCLKIGKETQVLICVPHDVISVNQFQNWQRQDEQQLNKERTIKVDAGTKNHENDCHGQT